MHHLNPKILKQPPETKVWAGLATLLEGVGYLFKISSAILQKNILFWCFYAVKLDNSCNEVYIGTQSTYKKSSNLQFLHNSVENDFF